MKLKECGNCGKLNLMNPGKFCSDDCLIEDCDKDDFHLSKQRANVKAKERKAKEGKRENRSPLLGLFE